MTVVKREDNTGALSYLVHLQPIYILQYFFYLIKYSYRKATTLKKNVKKSSAFVILHKNIKKSLSVVMQF